MKIKEMAVDAVNSGIKPIRLSSHIVNSFSDAPLLLRTELSFESLDLGVISFEQYYLVAGRTKQGDQIVERHVEKLFCAYRDLIRVPVAAITFPVFLRTLKEGRLSKILFEAFARHKDVAPNKICVELPLSVLYEDPDEMKKYIDEIRAMGVKVAICELGDPFCPLIRLSALSFDYAFINGKTLDDIRSDEGEKAAKSLVRLLQGMGLTVVAPNLLDSIQKSAVERCKAEGYTMCADFRETNEIEVIEE